MAIERADEKSTKKPRKITLRGKPLRVDDASPIAIARALKKDSPASKREARLQEAERKLGLR
jgi:hypothetical protein